jgi:polyhydroxybutyrate depolymerase
MARILIMLGLLCVNWAIAPAAHACGAVSPCKVEGGEYRFLVPEAAPGAPTPGVMIFIHGHRSSAHEMLAYTELVEAARMLNLILVAPQGLNDTWSTPGSPTQNRNEVAFLRRVLDDLPLRMRHDPRRVVLSGFSQGASVVWHVACQGERRVRAYVPIAGVWWQPMPETCPGPVVNLLHIHGMADAVMPMAGRRLRETWQQGDVKEAIRRMSLHNACGAAATSQTAGALTCAQATSCAPQASLALCLHEGDHHTDPRWFVLLREHIEAMMP